MSGPRAIAVLATMAALGGTESHAQATALPSPCPVAEIVAAHVLLGGLFALAALPPLLIRDRSDFDLAAGFGAHLRSPATLDGQGPEAGFGMGLLHRTPGDSQIYEARWQTTYALAACPFDATMESFVAGVVGTERQISVRLLLRIGAGPAVGLFLAARDSKLFLGVALDGHALWTLELFRLDVRVTLVPSVSSAGELLPLARVEIGIARKLAALNVRLGLQLGLRSRIPSVAVPLPLGPYGLVLLGFDR